MILIEETIQVFGYDPASLPPFTKKKIIRQCDRCGGIGDAVFRWGDSPCGTCRSKASILLLNQTAKSIGLSPKGLTLRTSEEHRKRNRVFNANWRRVERKTLRGKVINRIRVSLRLALKGKGSISMLPYGRDELIAHINSELVRYNHACPLCGSSIADKFDIDHRVPLSSAVSAGDVIELFALKNLSVLCPECNQHRKKDRHVDY